MCLFTTKMLYNIPDSTIMYIDVCIQNLILASWVSKLTQCTAKGNGLKIDSNPNIIRGLIMIGAL